MNPLRWIRNVLSGRYRDWNDVHNQTFTEIWEQASALPPPGREILTDLLVSSLSICERLVGPDAPNPLLKVDFRHLNIDQFRRLHAAQTAAMAGTYAAINPQFRRSIEQGLSALFPSEPGTNATVQ